MLKEECGEGRSSVLTEAFVGLQSLNPQVLDNVFSIQTVARRDDPVRAPVDQLLDKSVLGDIHHATMSCRCIFFSRRSSSPTTTLGRSSKLLMQTALL